MAESSIETLLDETTKKNIDSWLNGSFDEETKVKVRTLLKEHPEEAINAFYKTLTFGTGGMRGLMGLGTNRLNVFTIQLATQGLANYLHSQAADEIAVLIGYDSRNNSRLFAETSAKVLAANGITVYLFRDIRPTPLVSFGCRYKKCLAAIMFTASHNPPEYNGFKVYWSDGGQVLPPHDIGIVQGVAKITDLSQVKILDTLSDPHIQLIEEDVDDAYLDSITTLALYPEENQFAGNNLKMIYSSLHGTGITLIPRALKLWGFSNLSYVDSQIIPDGNFPTAHYPNPEEKEALTLGIEKLQNTDADIFVATDPDADRMGVVAMHEGKPFILTGNQIACISLEHICQGLKEQGKLTSSLGFVKSIVTSELFRAICNHYGVYCTDVLAGFKYIAETIRNWESDRNGYQYIYGAEESYGSLLGTFSRDKDAVVSTTLIAEVALHGKLQGKTLVDLLHDLHRKYGIYWEEVFALKFEESKKGKEEMAKALEILRKNPITEIGGMKVNAIDDFLEGKKYDLRTNQKTNLALPETNMLIYWLEGGSKVMIRPSGTEPKVKIYCGLLLKEFTSIEDGEALAQEKTKALIQELKDLISL